MSQRRDELRAADVDRAFVADLLKKAVDEGRLSLSEFDERLQQTYESRTYGDLDKVIGDLPRPSRRSMMVPAPPVSPVPTGWAPKEPQRGASWLFYAWRAWAIAVAVNVVIWILVSLTNAELVYPWPLWVAGPWGAVLAVSTIFNRDRGDPRGI